MRPTPKKRRWLQTVRTISTFPPKGLFAKDPETIACVMATKKVSPKGIGSGIRMVQYFINRAGNNLSAAHRERLEKAKQLFAPAKQRSLRPKKAKTEAHRRCVAQRAAP